VIAYDRAAQRLTNAGRLGPIALTVGVLGLAAAAAGFFVDRQQFAYSWLLGFVFWLSLALGGLFFTMLHHLVGARWSVVLRRLGENIMDTLPLMALFALPVLFSLQQLYHWSHPELVATDAILRGKEGFLNPTFFAIRMVVYFAIWIGLARLLVRGSLKQDAGHTEAFTNRMRRVSAPGMILFALTITFAAFDWLMSLDAHWYSTIFGAYFFAGAVLGMLAFLTLVVMRMNRHGVLTGEISTEHYHDLGKMLFSFVIFWAYMAFSQYLLIWYGNIPEETIWFLHRGEGSWLYISLTIVFGHFAIPFFLLFPEAPKRHRGWMTGMAIWILLMHWIDLYWLVMPGLHPHGAVFAWQDLAATAGIGGVAVWYFWRLVAKRPLVPIKDPLLDVSIHTMSP
jgi:hypothetical protein